MILSGRWESTEAPWGAGDVLLLPIKHYCTVMYPTRTDIVSVILMKYNVPGHSITQGGREAEFCVPKACFLRIAVVLDVTVTASYCTQSSSNEAL